MLGDQPVVMFTFAGRQRYMEPMLYYSLKSRPFVDKHALCLHTANPKDLEYIHEKAFSKSQQQDRTNQDFAFLFGDLNFRINLANENVRLTLQQY